jgi:murein DD-endopeptidase MepM/ murein hydrolase activator NlpD
MEKNSYTVLIFPGAHGKLRKVQIPYYVAYFVVTFSILGLLAAVGMAASYARMLWKVANYNDLRSQSAALQTQYRHLENKATLANAKLNSLQSLAEEVAMSYGFGSNRRLRFPLAVLNLAAQSNSTVDASYRASLYAFNAMKTAATDPEIGAQGLNFVPAAAPYLRSLPSIWPVRGEITNGFGDSADPFSGAEAFHPGVDIAAPMGTPVEATANGLVIQAGWETGYGNTILIDHGDGITTRYGHLSKILVVVGEQVKRGEVIGAVGMTGRATGPHLHYEVRIHDTPVNPARFLPS